MYFNFFKHRSLKESNPVVVRHRRTPFPLILLSSLLLTASSTPVYAWAPSITFGAEYIQTWDDNCYPGASDSWLYYTKPTIQYFHAEMLKYGHRSSFLYGNTSAEATDIKETQFNHRNHDSIYGDANELYAYAGHGGNSDTYFYAPMCILKGRGLSASERSDRATFYSHQARWGETDDSTPGRMRWAIMDTCHSIPPLAHQVWKKTFGPRFEYLLGFRHYSVFVSTTDETLEDWAENVFDDGDTFQSGWFDAAEDWFISAMDASALSVGDSKSEAVSRLKNQTASYPKRSSSSPQPKYFAWAWTNFFSPIHNYTNLSNSFGD